jgi:hypothetical protein
MVFAAENPGLFIFMIQELRKFIRSLIAEVFVEATIDQHVYDNFDLRIDLPIHEVGFEEGSPSSKASNIVVVGTKKMPEDKKTEIREKIDFLKGVNLPKDKSYGIKLTDLFVDPESVDYFSERDKNLAKGKTLVYLVKYGRSYSVGNQAWVTTYETGGNHIQTLMLRRSYYPAEKEAVDTKGGMRWSAVIKNWDVVAQKKIR